MSGPFPIDGPIEGPPVGYAVEYAVEALGYAPHVVLGAYLAFLIALGWVGWRRSRSTDEDFFLAGREQGLIVTAATIMATYFSGWAMLTFPGWVYEHGVAPMLLALNLPVAGAAVYVLGSRIRRVGRARGFVTPGDLLGDYYGGSALVHGLVCLTGLLYVLPYVIVQIKAGGHLAQAMFPETPSLSLAGLELSVYDAGSAALAGVTMLYVLLGGMRSVAWTDVAQGLLLLAGMIVAGVTAIVVLGGPAGFFQAVSSLEPRLLRVAGPEGRWNPWALMTFCAFASLASVIQPGQWMRMYAARSGATLRRTAVIFASVLPAAYLLGVLLVGLGGRAITPPANGPEGLVLPEGLAQSDQIVVFVLRQHLPLLLGGVGVAVVAVILVSILAASMSTADSNLHALSALFTRDVYQRFLRRRASEAERTWVGRAVIVLATAAALAISYAGEANPGLGLGTIAQVFLLAMAFSCQLLPMTVDALFLRRGTRWGAIAGVLAGLSVVVVFLLRGEQGSGWLVDLRRLFDVGMLGAIVNASVFALVSTFTPPLDPDHVRRFAADVRAGS